MNKTTLIIAIALLGFASCGENKSGVSDGGTDVDTDTDSYTDSDTDVDWSCPGVVEQACSIDNAYRLGAQASDLGDGWAFVDANDRGVLLANRPDGSSGGTEPVLVVGEWGATVDVIPGDYAVVTLEETPEQPLIARDLISGDCPYSEGGYGFLDYESVLGYPAVALLCSQASCALFAMVVDDPSTARLAPIPGGEIPFEDVRGLIHLASYQSGSEPADPVCAYGDGFACFDGEEWTVELEPGEVGTILDAAVTRQVGEPRVVAVGEACLIMARTASGFEEVPLGCDVDLVTVDSEEDFFAAGGDGMMVMGLPGETLECPIEGSHITMLRIDVDPTIWDDDRREVTAFTDQGRVFEVWYQGTEVETCEFEEPLDGPPLSWTMLAYDDAFGTMVITESSTYDRQEGGGFE